MICYFSRTSAIINSISGAVGTLCYGEAPMMIIINNKIQLQNVFIDNTRLFASAGTKPRNATHKRETSVWRSIRSSFEDTHRR